MRSLAAAAMVGLATIGTAAAQTSPPATSVEGGSAGGQSLSSKLSKSDGVITPKADVDPGIHVGAPDPHPNSTPVVPPSATGGGNAK